MAVSVRKSEFTEQKMPSVLSYHDHLPPWAWPDCCPGGL